MLTPFSSYLGITVSGLVRLSTCVTSLELLKEKTNRWDFQNSGVWGLPVRFIEKQKNLHYKDSRKIPCLPLSILRVPRRHSFLLTKADK
jgi:hypothetical protein